MELFSYKPDWPTINKAGVIVGFFAFGISILVLLLRVIRRKKDKPQRGNEDTGNP